MPFVLERDASLNVKESNGTPWVGLHRRLFGDGCIKEVYVRPTKWLLYLGYSIYDHPYLYGIIPLLLVGILSLGNFRLERNTDMMAMFMLRHGQIPYAKKVLDTNFSPQRLTHLVVTWNPYANLTSRMVVPTQTEFERDGVLTREFFQEIADFFQTIKSMEVPTALLNCSDIPSDPSIGRWIQQNVHHQSSRLLQHTLRSLPNFLHKKDRDVVTLEDVCVRKEHIDQCDILNPLDIYTHAKDWGTPIIAFDYPNFYSKAIKRILRLDITLGGVQITRLPANVSMNTRLLRPRVLAPKHTSTEGLWGEPLDPQTATGSVVVHNASAVGFHFLLRGDTPEIKQKSALWEAALIALTQSMPDANIKLHIFTERSFNDETYKSLTVNRKNLLVYIVSGTLLVAGGIIMNFSFSWLRTKIWSVVVGFSLSFLAASGGIGSWFILGNKHSPGMDSVLFLVLALSVDIFFIFIHTFCAMVLSASTPRERIRRTFQKAGISLTISCFSALSFFLVGGVITDIPGVRAFYFTSALCILYLYLLSFTTFVAVLSWEARRESFIKEPMLEKIEASQNVQPRDDCNNEKLIEVTEMSKKPQRPQLTPEMPRIGRASSHVNGPLQGAGEVISDVSLSSSPRVSCVALNSHTPEVQQTICTQLPSDQIKHQRIIENNLANFFPTNEIGLSSPPKVTIKDPDALYSSQRLRAPQELKSTVGYFSREFFRTLYASMIMHPISHVVVLLGFLVSWSVLGYYAFQSKAGIIFSATIPHDSYITSFANVHKKVFPFLGEQCTIIIPNADTVPWWEPKVQNALFQMTQTLAAHNHSVLMLNGLTSFLSYQYGIGPTVPNDPRDDTWKRRSSYGNNTMMQLVMSLSPSNRNTPPPNSAKTFYNALKIWLGSLQGASYRPMFAFDRKTGMLRSWKFHYWLSFMVNDSEEAPVRLKPEFQAMETVKPYFTALLYSPFVGYWEVENTVIRVALINVAIAIGTIGVIAFLLIPDALCATVMVFTIVMIDVCVLGTMVILKMRLNSITTIFLIFSTCFAIDFTVHITSFFSRAAGRSSSERLRDTLLVIGPPMTKGMVCVFCSIIPFGFTRTYTLLTILKVFITVLFWSFLHGLLFIPIVLFFVGKRHDVLISLESSAK